MLSGSRTETAGIFDKPIRIAQTRKWNIQMEHSNPHLLKNFRNFLESESEQNAFVNKPNLLAKSVSRTGI